MNLSYRSNAAKLGLTVAVALFTLGLSSVARSDVTKIPAAEGYLGSGWRNIGPNRSGEAVHGMFRPYSSGRVSAYRNGQLTTLSLNDEECDVTKINEAGDIVGYRRHPSGMRIAFIARRNGQIIDLGTLGGTYSHSHDVNEGGDVVGFSYLVGNEVSHAFVYRGGQMVDVNPIGSRQSIARTINDSGDIAGDYIPASSATNVYRSFLLTRLGQFVALPYGALGGVVVEMNEAGDVIGNSHWAVGNYNTSWLYRNGSVIPLSLGGTYSSVMDINEAGDVVGEAQVPSGAYHAFLYTRYGQMIDIGALGGERSFARYVNEAGDVAGIWYPTFGINGVTQHAFLYRNGQMIDLSLGGPMSGLPSYASTTRPFTEAGDVIGWSDSPFGRQGFVYRNGQMTMLTLGGSSAEALDINEAGDVVGYGYTPSGRRHAFVFRSGQMIDLGTITAYGMGAAFISNSGHVFGTGTIDAAGWATAFVTHVDQADDHTPPAISGLLDISVDETDPAGTAVNLGTATVFDMVDENPTLSNDAPETYPLGQTVVTWTATDKFGNVSTKQQVVTVNPGSPANQLANLSELIEDFVASGGVSSQAANSLDAKVDAATAALAQGNANAAKTAMNDLKALVNYVEAQTGNHITAAAADAIIARANAIIAALGG